MDSSSDKLRPILELLATQSLNSQTYRANIELLLKLYKNIYRATPNSEQFTKISLDKARSKLWSKGPAIKTFMLETGWTEQNDHIHFSDHKNLRSTIDFLAQERSRVIPSDEEWVSTTKVENVTPRNVRDLKEERLRQEATERRVAEYAACLNDIQQRKLMQECIRQEIRADNEHRRKMRGSD